MTDAWLCDVCGALVTGDMCRKCGNQRAPVAPTASQPGSYWSILGIHNAGGFRGYGIFVGPILLLAFLITIRTRLTIALLAAAVAFTVWWVVNRITTDRE